MLGRHHISISIATILPFLIPLVFIENKSAIIYAIAFLIAVMIGSLLPDADCGGKATIYYRFPIIDYVMKAIVIKATILLFNNPKIREKLRTTQEVKDEHRGIMHSPIGILVSSIMLTLIPLIIIIASTNFNFILLLAIFFGLVIGQLLHILEDSCTISGINWAFPFNTRELKGSILTFEGKEIGKKDIRIMLYQYILSAVSLILFLGYAFNKINLNLFLLYLILLSVLAFIWFLIIIISRMPSEGWMRDVEKVKQFKSFERKFVKGKWSKDLEKNISNF